MTLSLHPRRGKTRFPKRHVHVRALNELGYPYQEDVDKITVQLALSKEQVEELVDLSREYQRRSEMNRISYYYPATHARTGRSEERLLKEPFQRHHSCRHVRWHSSPSPAAAGRFEDLGLRTAGPLTIISRDNDYAYDDDDGEVDITTRKETSLDGERQRIVETEKNRKVPHPRLVKMMMATLT